MGAQHTYAKVQIRLIQILLYSTSIIISGCVRTAHGGLTITSGGKFFKRITLFRSSISVSSRISIIRARNIRVGIAVRAYFLRGFGEKVTFAAAFIFSFLYFSIFRIPLFVRSSPASSAYKRPRGNEF